MDKIKHINELFLPYELAIIAKQKGFNEKCFAHYNQNGVFLWKILCADEDDDYTVSVKDIIDFEHHKDFIQAPIHQQITDWLYKEHSIWITLLNYDHGEPTDKLPRGFSFYIEVYGHCEIGESKNGYFKTQYEALNKAILEAFTLF